MTKKPKLQIYGLIGYPLGHTLSPFMHNAALAKRSLNGIYLPLSLNPDNLSKGIKVIRDANFSGFNVTIPFKSACIKYLDKVDKIASMIGAVNTVVIRTGKLIGYNTDATGFLKSIKEDLRFTPKEKSCVVVGSGGASRAISFALAKEGAKKIFITDIDQEKAKSLVKNIRRYFKRCKTEVIDHKNLKTQLHTLDYQLIVNATPLGLKKNDLLPFDIKAINKNACIYDLVYNPSPTELVKLAKKRGIKAVCGLGMLLHQGAEAFTLWTKVKAPLKEMKMALKENLK